MKKVRCIDDLPIGVGFEEHISKGKVYDVLKENEDFYVIVCDNGLIRPKLKYRFEEIISNPTIEPGRIINEDGKETK